MVLGTAVLFIVLKAPGRTGWLSIILRGEGLKTKEER